MEMLIVVAIIAVLVAIAIPVYTAQMHKVRVAADKANLRAYYAQIQADYMLTEKQNPNVKVMDIPGVTPDYTTISFLDGAKVKLQAGIYFVRFQEDKGYTITYQCSNSTDYNETWG